MPSNKQPIFLLYYSIFPRFCQCFYVCYKGKSPLISKGISRYMLSPTKLSIIHIHHNPHLIIPTDLYPIAQPTDNHLFLLIGSRIKLVCPAEEPLVQDRYVIRFVFRFFKPTSHFLKLCFGIFHRLLGNLDSCRKVIGGVNAVPYQTVSDFRL